jgi:putative ABC transport system permease protein
VITIFAGVALLLASIGIYGVVSYSVSQQTHFIGVRMALGASPADILKMVMKQGLWLALIGRCNWSSGVVRCDEVTSDLLFAVTTTDAGTFAIVTGTLFRRCIAGLLPASEKSDESRSVSGTAVRIDLRSQSQN